MATLKDLNKQKEPKGVKPKAREHKLSIGVNW
jgi:hypothetical protein